MKTKLTVILSIIAASQLSACASILSGSSQTITLETNPSGANCQLTREGRNIGTVNSTPGAVMVGKTKHDISVACTKEGYQDATAFLNSGTEGATFVNILAGGVVGWGIDSASGADNKYPEVTTITLVPVGVTPPTTQVELTKVIAQKQSSTSKEKVIKSTNKQAPGTATERLKQLEDLKANNLISDDDYKKTREKILSEI